MENPTPVNKQILSRLTHHVRNPFNGIIGFTDLLLNHFEKLSDDDIKNYVQIVHQLSKKALLRSENLSWWLKFYTKNLVPVFQDTDVNEVVKDELSYFGPEIAKQHLDLELDKASNGFVFTDKVMLQSVIRNIIFNIIEFTPVGEAVDIKLHRTGNKLSLTFTNTFKDQPGDETLNFLKNLKDKEINTDTMPDSPGLWCIKALCQVLNLDLYITLKGNHMEVLLELNT